LDIPFMTPKSTRLDACINYRMCTSLAAQVNRARHAADQIMKDNESTLQEQCYVGSTELQVVHHR
jgi:hypothetical protein